MDGGYALTTTQDLIYETRGHLMSGARERQNTLNGAHDASTTTFTFTYAPQFGAGDVIAVDLELVRVMSDPGATTATVHRGWGGSTAASHSADALITVSPAFSDFRIFQTLNAELSALSSPGNGLFQTDTVSVTFNSAVVGYDLTGVTDLIDVYRVYYDEVGPDKLWPEVSDYWIRRNADTTDFASGLQIVIPDAQPGNAVRVVYKKPFTALTSLSDDVQAVSGLPATANDIPPLGAAHRLATGAEIQRNLNNSQGDTRRAQEVPQGALARSSVGLMDVYRRRVGEEAARLSAAYPHRKR